MFKIVLTQLVQRIKGGIQPRSWLSQRGAMILPLALAGLLGTSVIAVPLLNRAMTSVEAAKTTSSIQGVDAESAAWYAMWRLEHDPTIHDEFTGTPPTTTFEFRGAQISVVGVEPPDNSGIILSMSVSPNRALPDTPTLVTYTLKVKNDDDQPHDILRVETSPAGSYRPSYVMSSTSGFTTVDPSTSGNKFTWTPMTPVTLDAFGEEKSMSWEMIVDESEGNYWMDGEVKIDGVGDIEGLTEANVMVSVETDLEVDLEVTPAEVEAGEETTFAYTMTLTNTGASDQTVTELKFWITKLLDIVPGTSAGITPFDPTRNSDFRSNDRWEWTWSGLSTQLPAGGQLVQTFSASGALTPGTWFGEGAFDTVESEANGQEVAATNLSDAPIKAVRVYDIHVDYLDRALDIEAKVDHTGVTPLTWEES